MRLFFGKVGWPPLAGSLLLLVMAASPFIPLDGLRLSLLLLLTLGALLVSLQNATLAGWVAPWSMWAPWLLWSALSISWSLESVYSSYYWLNEVLMAAAMYGLGMQLARQGIDERWLFAGLVLMVFLLALISVAHVVAPEQIPLYYPGWLDNEPQATAYLVLGVAAATWYLLLPGRSNLLLSLFLLAGVHVVAWVALKRSPYLAVIGQTAAMLLVSRYFGLEGILLRRLRWTMVVFLLFSCIVAIQVGNSRPASYAAGAPAETGMVAAVGNNERYQTWAFWLERGWGRSWYGTGVGRYLPNHAYVDKTVTVDPWFVAHAHNVFINQWLQLGVPGLLAYIWIWLSLLSKSGKGLGAANCQQVRKLSGLALCALLSMLIRNGTDDVLFAGCGAAWWLPIGYMLARANYLTGRPLMAWKLQ